MKGVFLGDPLPPSRSTSMLATIMGTRYNGTMPTSPLTPLNDQPIRDGDYSASGLRAFMTPEEAAKYVVDLEPQNIRYAIPTEPGTKRAIIDAVHLEREARLKSDKGRRSFPVSGEAS
jgi:hypothetical protein